MIIYHVCSHVRLPIFCNRAIIAFDFISIICIDKKMEYKPYDKYADYSVTKEKLQEYVNTDTGYQYDQIIIQLIKLDFPGGFSYYLFLFSISPIFSSQLFFFFRYVTSVSNRNFLQTVSISGSDRPGLEFQPGPGPGF